MVNYEYNYIQLYCDISVEHQKETSKILDIILDNNKDSKLKILKRENIHINLSPEIQKWKIEEYAQEDKILLIPLVNANYKNKEIANYVCLYDFTKNFLCLDGVISNKPEIYTDYEDKGNYIIIEKENLEFISEKIDNETVKHLL